MDNEPSGYKHDDGTVIKSKTKSLGQSIQFVGWLRCTNIIN